MTAQPYRLILFFSASLCLLAGTLALGAALPALRGRVNDYAGVMGQEQERDLEARLAQFEQQTGHQVAILTIPTLEGEDIEGFGIRVAESWKIGKKGFDNGVILIVAIKDRRLRLEVGYGLEGVLPDATAKQIISDYIVPRFRVQDYAGGIVAGTDAVLKVINNEPLPESARKRETQQDSPTNPLLMFLITLAVFGVMAYASGGGRRYRNGMWATHGRRRGPMIFGGPGGFGGFGGGGFGGGFGGGGGFSGGGGSFGGGGASSSW